jgi:hypothetical protein
MNGEQLNVIFEACLLRLQCGESLEQVLADYPEWRRELRPALEAVQAVWKARGSDTVPIAAMARSREQLRLELQRRQALSPRESAWQRFWRALHVPHVASLLVAVTLVLAGLGITGLVTAQALPGQAFYPVKLATERLTMSLPASAAEKLAREEEYDLRRNQEFSALLRQQRDEVLYFSGFLSTPDGQDWQVGTLSVTAGAELVPVLAEKTGRYVTVCARTRDDGSLALETVEDRVYHLEGQVEAVEGERVKVGGLWVEAEREDAPAALRPGDAAAFSLVRLADGRLLATHFRVQEGGSAIEHSRNAPTKGSGAVGNP